MRFTAYFIGVTNKEHQEALLIYNKVGVERKVAISYLAIMDFESVYQSARGDLTDEKILPIFNFPSYAPFEGSHYQNPKNGTARLFSSLD